MNLPLFLQSCIAEAAHVQSPWLTIQEAADYLRVSVSAVTTLTNRGQLRTYAPKGMKVVRYSRSDLDKLMEDK